MIRNYFKIILRNLIKDRQFTLLNLTGLSAGLACSFLIYLWIQDERSIDKFYENDPNLYQVMKVSPNGDGTQDARETTSVLLAGSLVEDFPEVEYAVTVVQRDKGVVSSGDKHVKSKGRIVGKDYFRVFPNVMVKGDVLSDKYSVMLSDALALKLFNTTENITGKTIEWDHGNELKGTYTVAGIFKAAPENATEQADILFPFALYFDTFREKYNLASWGNNPSRTYVTLKEGTDVEGFNNKIKTYLGLKHLAEHGKKDIEWQGHIFLQRFSDRYLYGKYENGVQAGGRIAYVRLFSIIAIFILLIACINFMNLSTAKASHRAKEVGVKKVMGVQRGSLILQYIGESMVMAFLSLSIAILLAGMLFQPFKAITGKDFNLHFNPALVLTIIGITIITGLLAGSYPALYLSGLRPAQALKGKLSASVGAGRMRKGLVIFQFAISAVLIVAMLIIYQQINFIHSKNLGYNKDNVIRFSSEGKLRDGQQAFLETAKKMPGVINASGMGGDFVGMHGGGSGVEWPEQVRTVEFDRVYADYDLIETLDMKMAEGRSFSREYADSNAVIFNETAIAAMGLKDPIGKRVRLWGKEKQIIGVIKDFNYESLYQTVHPFLFELSPKTSNIIVKIERGMEKTTLSYLDKFYQAYNKLPFEYQFLDEDYAVLYAAENRVATLSKYFAGLAILISCLGLFGLAAFTAQKRQREIGIRKVVGASVNSIVLMLSKDFLQLVFIAVLIAFPLSWWAMNDWLNNFAYRINIGPGVFVTVSAAIVIITLLTIGYQSLKAALANPVKSLSME